MSNQTINGKYILNDSRKLVGTFERDRLERGDQTIGTELLDRRYIIDCGR